MSYSIAMLSLHTSPLDIPGRTRDAGGMNVYMRALARELGQRHINVDIFTRWKDAQAAQIVQLYPNVRVIHIQAGPLAPVDKSELYQYIPDFVQHVEEFRQSRFHNYDVLHSHYWLSGVAGMQLSRLWNVPHVIMFHTLARLKQLANPNEHESQLRLDMEQRLIQHCNRIIAATSEERTHMIRYCGARPHQVQVVPCGVDLELFVQHDKLLARQRFGLSLHDPIVLFAGRLEPFKGPDLLLRVAAMMQTKAQIVIAGGKLEDDAQVQQLQALAQQLQIESWVKFLGARPQQDLPELYSAADVTVMPSYHETFGMVAVESLACGTPVVATKTGGLMTVIRHGENGFLVPRCAGFFAERIDALLSDTELAAQIRQHTRTSVQQFDWKQVGCLVHQLYDELAYEEHCLAAL